MQVNQRLGCRPSPERKITIPKHKLMLVEAGSGIELDRCGTLHHVAPRRPGTVMENSQQASARPEIPVPDLNGLVQKVAYRTRYFDDPRELLAQVLAKTVVPYQVEVQPGRIKGRELCWMPCSYCYGGSSENVGERLSPDRYLDIIRQTGAGPHGGIKKAIYAGYATDPLNYEHVDDLIAASAEMRQVIGVHSKLLRISDRLIATLAAPTIMAESYVTVSFDAGSQQSYNDTHSIKSKANIYAKVLANIRRLSDARRGSGASLDLSANYLITRVNNDSRIVETGVRDLIDAGIDTIRLSFPQVPRGQESEGDSIIPTRAEIAEIYKRLKPVIDSFAGGRVQVIILDVDSDHGISVRRTLPCFARFIYPAISYDGFLSHCSQSAAPHFRDMALGNLQTRDFWDSFYDYDPADFWDMLDRQHAKMTKNDCRCDRKEHTVNQVFKRAFGTERPA